MTSSTFPSPKSTTTSSSSSSSKCCYLGLLLLAASSTNTASAFTAPSAYTASSAGSATSLTHLSSAAAAVPPPAKPTTPAKSSPISFIQRRVVPHQRRTYVWYNTDYEPLLGLNAPPKFVQGPRAKGVRRNRAQRALLGASVVAYLVWWVNQIPAVPWTTLGYLYKAFPVRAAILTCGIKSALADAISQVKEHVSDDSVSQDNFTAAAPTFAQNFELRQTLSYVTYGAFCLGLGSSIMYTRIMPRILPSSLSGMAAIVTQTCFDNFINAPLLWLPPAYIVKSLFFPTARYTSVRTGDFKPRAIASNTKVGLQNYLQDVREKGLLFKYWSIWLPAQMLTFSPLVPTHFRSPMTAGISFCWLLVLMNLSGGDGDNGSD